MGTSHRRGMLHLLSLPSLLLLVISLFLLSIPVRAQDCSALNPCATGCCNKFGYCGVGDDYCGADCVSTCDYLSECDASRPCATGCCNQYGYCGLGPDFCAEDVCVAGCDRRSECDPGGYGEFAESAKCPLNVCCSKFGFCGTTKDFCGNKQVRRPSCSKTNGMSRVVGYYEGWSMRRYCHSFYPEQIPRGVYTHLNYAFASIDPETFEILAPDSYEAKMMKRLTSLKNLDPDLKVFVAVGGWTFNDPGPTATVFSDIASSVKNQRAFFKSLISFMSTYNFDGIDLDWEYPVADDRSGRPEDYENFPRFIANLKKALKGSGGRDGLSITLPASYWYLQHFDIINLQAHVDFFNIMSYDLHGAWDQNNEWLEPQLNSHTNLTEITNALDLLWRNEIQPSKVVLGMAFYARVFAASSPSCMEPGCIFQSGGNAGPCSNEVGILLNSEIVDIMNEQQVKPTLDKEAAVKILKFDTNQWLTYDDAETFKLKAQFASSQCLGGVMVWAVSHDLPYGNFSRALGEAANRKVKAIAMSAHSEDNEVRKVHQQCGWTDCYEDCPSGWTIITRADDDGSGEGMIDHTGCQKGSDHFFCCPPDSKLPTCGWYGHRNGDCNGRDNCPAGMIEIGSNEQHCDNNNYQAACCTYQDIPSMKLYTQCQWGDSPKCDKDSCSGGTTLVANSSTGTGGDYCEYRNYWEDWLGNYATYQERVYCCDQEEDTKWEDCEWEESYGLLRVDPNMDLENYCFSNCPNDKVRVALETRNGCDGANGGRVRCCKPKYITSHEKSAADYTDEEKRLNDQLKAFMESPTCGLYDETLSKRGWVDDEYAYGNVSLNILDERSHSLIRRITYTAETATAYIVYRLVFEGASSPELSPSQLMNMWSLNVLPLYQHLTIPRIRTYAHETLDWVQDGIEAFVTQLICNMDYFNRLFSGSEDALDCECDTVGCCIEGMVCDEIPEGTFDVDVEEYGEYGLQTELVTRGNNRELDATLVDGLHFKFVGRVYPKKSDVENDPNHWLRNKAFGYTSGSLCYSGSMSVMPKLSNKELKHFDIEHKLEMNTMSQYMKFATKRELPSGKPVPANLPALPIDYIRNHLRSPVLQNPPRMKGGETQTRPLIRIMNALGSNRNAEGFVMLLKVVNSCKMQLWRGTDVWDATFMAAGVESSDPAVAKKVLQNLRSLAGTIDYLNHPTIQAQMVIEAHDVEEEFRLADDAWVAKGNKEKEIGARWWRLIYKDLLETRSAKAQSLMKKWCGEMVKYWGVRTGDDAKEILDAVETLSRAPMTINMNGLNY